MLQIRRSHRFGCIPSGVMRRWFEQLIARQGLPETATLSVWLCSTKEMKDLNRRFRSVDAVTDVLSFPSGEKLDRESCFLGDLAICYEVAKIAARRLGHTTQAEAAHLFVHGFLHLLGFDHEIDGGEMRRKEADLLREMGYSMVAGNLPEAYGEFL